MTNGGKTALYALETIIREAPGTDKLQWYEQLLSADGWKGLHRSTYLNLAGYLINTSLDLQRTKGFERAIALDEHLLTRALSPEDETRVHYQLANAHSFRNELNPDDETRLSFFDSDDRLAEIVHLRKALSEDGLEQVLAGQLCQRYTNLGNALSHTGRIVEALNQWNEALRIDESFPMALGNRGMGKQRYAITLFDQGHKERLLHSAYLDLKGALSSSDLHPHAAQGFERAKGSLDSFVTDGMAIGELESYSLGDSEQEIRYRKWCLRHRLFLNPLNDVTTRTVAAHDVLHLPSMTVGIDESLPYPGLYNQLKQEFVSARYTFYEGLRDREDAHFSDREVLLNNTLDYPVYGYRTEQVKTGLRLSYSIFDKIAYFLNEYLDLGHSKNHVQFGTVWYESGDYNEGLHEHFENSENWLLNALYWLKKDFYGGPLTVEGSTDIAPETLERIRHGLEHRYLKVYDDAIASRPLGDEEGEPFGDTLKEPVAKSELLESGLKMLQIARAALIYLSLAVHLEEATKAESDAPTMPLHTDWFKGGRIG